MYVRATFVQQMNSKIAEVHHFVRSIWKKISASEWKGPTYVPGLTKRQARRRLTNTRSLDWLAISDRPSPRPQAPGPAGSNLHAFRITYRLEKIKTPATSAASTNKQIIQHPPPIQMSTDTTASRMRSRSEAERGPAANKRPPMCLEEFLEMFIECDSCD